MAQVGLGWIGLLLLLAWREFLGFGMDLATQILAQFRLPHSKLMARGSNYELLRTSRSLIQFPLIHFETSITYLSTAKIHLFVHDLDLKLGNEQ